MAEDVCDFMLEPDIFLQIDILRLMLILEPFNFYERPPELLLCPLPFGDIPEHDHVTIAS